jgi:hypothetical protein
MEQGMRRKSVDLESADADRWSRHVSAPAQLLLLRAYLALIGAGVLIRIVDIAWR